MRMMTTIKETLVDKLVKLAAAQASVEELREYYIDGMYSFFGNMTYQEQKEFEKDLDENE
jgi:hypothetical protein